MIFTKELNFGLGTSGSITQNTRFLHFIENFDNISCINTLQANKDPQAL